MNGIWIFRTRFNSSREKQAGLPASITQPNEAHRLMSRYCILRLCFCDLVCICPGQHLQIPSSRDMPVLDTPRMAAPNHPRRAEDLGGEMVEWRRMPRSACGPRTSNKLRRPD